jgi:hypothetical protein
MVASGLSRTKHTKFLWPSEKQGVEDFQNAFTRMLLGWAQEAEGTSGHITVDALWSITESALRNAASWRSWGESRRIGLIFWKWPKPGKPSPTCTN